MYDTIDTITINDYVCIYLYKFRATTKGHNKIIAIIKSRKIYSQTILSYYVIFMRGFVACTPIFHTRGLPQPLKRKYPSKSPQIIIKVTMGANFLRPNCQRSNCKFGYDHLSCSHKYIYIYIYTVPEIVNVNREISK